MIVRILQFPLMTLLWFMTQTKVHWLSPTGGFCAEPWHPLPVRAGSAARWYAGETRRGARRTAAPWTHRSGPCTAAHGCSGPWTGIWLLLWVFSPLSWVPHFPSPNSHSPRARTEKKIHLMSSRSKKDWDNAHFLEYVHCKKEYVHCKKIQIHKIYGKKLAAVVGRIVQ